jgi:hypothetical protein
MKKGLSKLYKVWPTQPVDIGRKDEKKKIWSNLQICRTVSASGTELSGARRIFRAAIRGARQIDKFKKALAKDQRTTVSHLHKGLQYSRKRYPPIFMKTVKTSRF